LRDDARPLALVGDWLEQGAVLGSAPVRVASGAEDPFALLDLQSEVSGAEAAVGGGWVGWLGYDLGGRIERLPPNPRAPAPRRPFSLAFYDHVILFDGRCWWFEALWNDGRDAMLRQRLELWQSRMGTSPPLLRPAATTPFELTGNGVGGHLAAVADCCRRIAEGELFQANFCLRFDARYRGNLVDLFSRALPTARPRFGAVALRRGRASARSSTAS
jgi:anthranilate/para-aminobenzoate synthase component I